MKKIVHYSRLITVPELGNSVILIPLDHPDKERVSNVRPVRTSRVVNYDPVTGDIETENSIYKLFIYNER